MYEDKLPAEAVQLQEWLNQERQQQKKAEDYMNGKSIQKHHILKNKDWVENKMLPEEGRNHKKIAKLRVQDFEQQAEKDKARQNRNMNSALI